MAFLSKQRFLMFVIACAAIAILSACEEAGDATSAPSSTPAPEPTVLPEASPTVPSRTPEPTATPAPLPGDRVVATPTAQRSQATVVPTVVDRSSEPATGEVAGKIFLNDIASVEGAMLVGLDGVVLGELRPASESLESVCDNVSIGGSSLGSTSILNPDSVYGGAFGAHSPFNPDATAPPEIVSEGSVIGHLTVSPFFEHRIDPHLLLDHLGCSI